MGDTKDKKKIQSDRAARKLKEQEQAQRLKPDTTSSKGAGSDNVPAVTPAPARPKKGNK